MRLLLVAIGLASLSVVGWIFWRATTETREWREILALNARPKRSQAEADRLDLLVRRRIPDEDARIKLWRVAVLDGPEDRRRILVFFGSRMGRAPVRLHVFDETHRRLSAQTVDVGIHPCGLELKPSTRPELGPWSFRIESQTPGSPTVRDFVLEQDRPRQVSVEE